MPASYHTSARVKRLVVIGAVTVLAPFAVDAMRQAADRQIEVIGHDEEVERAVEVDQLVVATGLRPDLSLLGELRLDLDPALECPSALGPLIDPNIHSCGTVRPHGAFELAQPEPGFFIAGMKSYGRAPTFLLATGYEQVRSIAAYLAGDIETARRVELNLPQTGVCSSHLAPAGEACCAADADSRSAQATVPSACCRASSIRDVEPAEPA